MQLGDAAAAVSLLLAKIWNTLQCSSLAAVTAVNAMPQLCHVMLLYLLCHSSAVDGLQHKSSSVVAAAIAAALAALNIAAWGHMALLLHSTAVGGHMTLLPITLLLEAK